MIEIHEGKFINNDILEILGYEIITQVIIFSFSKVTYNIWYNEKEKEFISTVDFSFSRQYVFDKNKNFDEAFENIGYEISKLGKSHLMIGIFYDIKNKNYYYEIDNYCNYESKEFNLKCNDKLISSEINNDIELIFKLIKEIPI